MLKALASTQTALLQVAISPGGHLALFLGALDEAVSENPLLYRDYSSKVRVVLNMFGPSNLAAPDMIAGIWDLSLFF